MGRWEILGEGLGHDRPAVMGIVNVTPDSFSDGGRSRTVAEAVSLGLKLEGEGAVILDVGGESTRPGSEPVDEAEEIRRVVPVIEALARATRLPISVDTSKAEVARLSLAVGASVVNDVTALGDPLMGQVVVGAGASLVLMHMAGTPRTMQVDPQYGDVVEEVLRFLGERVERALAAGIPRERIAVDPGIGFGKTLDHNLALLRHLGRFAELGCARLVGVSRKGMLGTLTGRPLAERAGGSIAAALWAVQERADVVRVHDVGPTVDAIKVWCALRG